MTTVIETELKLSSPKKTKSKHYCYICDKTLIGGTYHFKAHLYMHKAVKPRYECPYCLKQYFRSDTYVRHINSHNGTQKTFVCDYCEREFVDKRNLISHLKIHDDSLVQRPDLQYTCLACGVSYCEDRLLKNHVRRIHFNMQRKEELHLKKTVNATWVEPVKDSEVCVEMTKINNNVIMIKKCGMKKTMIKKEDKQMSPTNPIYTSTQYSKAVCDYCNKEMIKKSLRSHIRERHLKIRKFKCDVCPRTFQRHYQLVNHVCGKPVRRGRNPAYKKEPIVGKL